MLGWSHLSWPRGAIPDVAVHWRRGRGSPQRHPVSKHHLLTLRMPDLSFHLAAHRRDGEAELWLIKTQQAGSQPGLPCPPPPPRTSPPSSCLRICQQHLFRGRRFLPRLALVSKEFASGWLPVTMTAPRLPSSAGVLRVHKSLGKSHPRRHARRGGQRALVRCCGYKQPLQKRT